MGSINQLSFNHPMIVLSPIVRSVVTRAANEGPRSFHNHRGGPYYVLGQPVPYYDHSASDPILCLLTVG